MNKFEGVLGRVSPKTCLKMDYFSKSLKIAKRWGLRP